RQSTLFPLTLISHLSILYEFEIDHPVASTGDATRLIQLFSKFVLRALARPAKMTRETFTVALKNWSIQLR
ncbi:MAG: hypothetical protein K2Z81_22920, partial [Cyanobacteria bacterium]|nr:hypothetical protein [Cyanobacteriota bacterium]